MPIGNALLWRSAARAAICSVVHPAAVIPAAAQTLPRRTVFRIKAGDLRQMGNRLGLQPLLLAPESELPVSRDRIRDGSPSRLVLGEHRLALIVGLFAAGRCIRVQPLVADLDLAQESSCRGTGGVRLNGEFEKTMALAVLSSCLALQRLPDQCLGDSNPGEDANKLRQTTR